jgi:hypothetical protein
MPTISNVMQLLNAKNAAKFGTTSKSMRDESKRRMASPRAKKLKQAAMKARANSRNLNIIFNRLTRVGLENQINIYEGHMKEYINLYNQLEPAMNITPKEKARLLYKMRVWQNKLFNEIIKRQRQRNTMYAQRSPSNHGNTPNFT